MTVLVLMLNLYWSRNESRTDTGVGADHKPRPVQSRIQPDPGTDHELLPLPFLKIVMSPYRYWNQYWIHTGPEMAPYIISLMELWLELFKILNEAIEF